MYEYRTYFNWLIFIAILNVTAPSLATENTAFTDAQAVFETSLAGDKKATEPAIEKFSELVQQDPSHPLYLAYLGSAYTLKARDAWMPWTRLRNAEKGLEMIDKALLMLKPQHDEQRLRGSIVSTEAHLVAVSTFLQVPKFMNRQQAAKDLLTATIETPVFEVSAPAVKGRLYLWAAEVAKREEQTDAERNYLEKALAVLPAGRHRDQSEQQLMEIAQ